MKGDCRINNCNSKNNNAENKKIKNYNIYIMMYSTYFKQTVKSVYDTAVRSNAEICQTEINFDQLHSAILAVMCVGLFYFHSFLSLFIY